MHNDFVILGPAADPAGIAGGTGAGVALAAIASSGAPFISRGDDSGTHTKERSLWTAAGLIPSGDWYREAGQGMGAVMTIASEVQGYTLADRGTWLAMKDSIDLTVLVEGDPRLFNPYGVIAVNPNRHRHVKYMEAMLLIAWLTSPAGQKLIGDFTVGGEVLFIPDVITDPGTSG
jgi:tungstate transport system substrate-binding protein